VKMGEADGRSDEVDFGILGFWDTVIDYRVVQLQTRMVEEVGFLCCLCCVQLSRHVRVCRHVDYHAHE
jgi:hypothetical protein